MKFQEYRVVINAIFLNLKICIATLCYTMLQIVKEFLLNVEKNYNNELAEKID